MMDRVPLLLLIAGCLVFGAIVFVELVPGGTDDDTASGEIAKRPTAAAAMRRQQNPRLDELLAAILARPLFSSTRRPPQSASPEAATDPDLAGTRLTGIVTEPGHRIAVFAVNGAKPLKLVEGEAVSGWRIESITPREVSLSGPSGTKTLQPKIDPNLAPPPGQPPPINPRARFPAPPAPPAPSAAAARSPAPLPGTAAAGQPNPAVPANPPLPLPNPARLRPQR
jgi:general secretion pathway protein N